MKRKREDARHPILQVSATGQGLNGESVKPGVTPLR